MSTPGAPAILGTQPPLLLDVGPLLDDMWTGIPVFTRRLAQSLLRHGGVDLQFSYHMTRVPSAMVLAAIEAGTGTFLREDIQRAGAEGYGPLDRNAHLLFPSVKDSFDIAAHEASTVHDMSTLVMPENHDEANVAHHMHRLKRELATNETVFCVSEATRAALELYYPSVAGKTRILYQYADWPEEFDAMDRNLPDLKLGNYAVVVGTVEPRKNLGLLIKALALPQIERSDIRFIVIGKKGWKVDQFLAGLTPDQRKRLIFSGFVSEFIKYRLIRHARFLVFPSVYEGFGIPALEAMSLGKPVLAATTSSFPEVIGEAGVFYDPLSATEFADAFEEIQDPTRYAELQRHTYSGAEAFNWRRMAQPVVEWVSHQ